MQAMPTRNRAHRDIERGLQDFKKVTAKILAGTPHRYGTRTRLSDIYWLAVTASFSGWPAI